jgi:hypothetical protein
MYKNRKKRIKRGEHFCIYLIRTYIDTMLRCIIVIGPQIIFNIEKLLINTIYEPITISTSANVPVHI